MSYSPLISFPPPLTRPGFSYWDEVKRAWFLRGLKLRWPDGIDTTRCTVYGSPANLLTTTTMPGHEPDLRDA